MCLIIMCVWFSAWVIRCMFVQVVVLAWMYACDRCVHKSALYTCTYMYCVCLGCMHEYVYLYVKCVYVYGRTFV